MRPRAADEDVIALQTGRRPRHPWRVIRSCAFGYPAVIASPSRLDDGTPFPTWAWLTCPHLTEAVSRSESRGDVARWGQRAHEDERLAAGLRELDRQVRAARARESGGEDACADVGVAGQADALGVKCLHAHVAYALAGLDDPIGRAVAAEVGHECEDARCAGVVRQGDEDEGDRRT